jgi:hypothetical protein
VAVLGKLFVEFALAREFEHEEDPLVIVEVTVES